MIDNSSSANHTTHVLNLWTSNEEKIVISASYAVKLTEGKYHFEFDVEGAESDSRLSYTVKAGETSLYTNDSTVVTTGDRGIRAFRADRGYVRHLRHGTCRILGTP